MFILRYLIIVLLSVMPFRYLYSQDFNFRHYQVEDGLSNNSTICCLQDSKGFLWFGTKDGLNRFDGYVFKIFRNDPKDPTSISNNFIRSLYEDRDGVLWVGAGSGLNRYNAATESFSRFKRTNTADIKEIIEDKAGNLWLIAGFRLCRINKSTDDFTWFKGSQYPRATSVTLSVTGEIWASGTDGYIYRYNASSGKFDQHDMFAHSPKANFKWIEKIYATSAGEILVGTGDQGFKIFNPQTGRYKDLVRQNTDQTGLYVRNFIEINSHLFWIGTESGIFIYNTTTGSVVQLKKKYNNPYSLSDNAIYSFCKDKEGGIWATSYFGGINYYPKQYTPFTRYYPKPDENSISGNVIREIHQDHQGSLWIGTDDAGLNRLELKSGLFSHFGPGHSKGDLCYSNIHGLLVDGDKLWIGTFEHGVDLMDLKNQKIIHHFSAGTGKNDLQSNFIYCMARLKNGTVLLGTSVGAYAFNAKNNNFIQLPYFPKGHWYSYLFEDSKGTIWATTYKNGIYYYNPRTGDKGTFRYQPSDSSSIGSDRVNSAFEDRTHCMWFATENGLCKLNAKKNSFSIYTTGNGLPSNFTLSILEDDRYNLWISTVKGLARLNYLTNKITVYKDVNGIINDQFNFNSAFKDLNGRLYFGSVKGMISFDPTQFQESSYVPPIYVTNFRVFSTDLAALVDRAGRRQSVINASNVVLNHEQATFSIDFAALGYTAPKMAVYAYMMKGLDKTWTILKENRTVYFTDLKAGKYTFRVKNISNPQGWNSHETLLEIEILPPWWRSNLAYSIYACLLFVIGYTALHLYHRGAEKQNRRKYELLKIVKEKEVSEAKIDFFTNVAHEIRTPLALIIGPIERLLKKPDQNADTEKNLRIMQRNTTRLIELTDQLLDFRQTEADGFSLNFTSTDVTTVLEDAFNSFRPLAEQKNLEYKLHIPMEKCCAPVDQGAFVKVLNNLLSNAIKYAGHRVSVRLFATKKGDRYFRIEIKNDGLLIPREKSEKIFEPFYRLPESTHEKGTGIGLAISGKLVQLHQGELFLKEQQSAFNIFCLKIPLNQETK